MEDRRIVKTKANLKQTLCNMLARMPFDRIRVTDLCKEANTSRITFYTYYDDKYELLDAVFEDMFQEMKSAFLELQLKENPANDLRLTCRHLVMTLVRQHREYPWFFRRLNVQDNMDLSLSYYSYMLNKIEEFEIEYHIDGRHAYDTRQLSAFLTLGFWGYYTASMKEKKPEDQIAEGALELVDELVSSAVITDSGTKS